MSEQDQTNQGAALAEGSGRLVSLDAYRGLVMLMMASGGLGIAQVAGHFKGSEVWRVLAEQTEHAEWVGCTVWDMIQPSFMFIVGAALPYSLARRRAKGQSFGRMLFHAIVRAVVLVGLGILLRSVGKERTYFTFEDVLTQIGLGYVFLFLLGWVKARWQFSAAAVILAGYWGLFALWPLPAAGFDYQKVGVGPEWKRLEGFAAHWEKNTNAAAKADEWLLNKFPPRGAFAYNKGGYLTANFVPSLGTMVFGLLAGTLLLSGLKRWAKFLILVGAGITGVAAGWALDWGGICPLVKRIWTPSWAVYAGGWTSLTLAVFYLMLDWPGWRWWALPLTVVGMNSIAMYCMAHLFDGFISENIKVHLGSKVFQSLGVVYEPMVAQGAVLVVLWLICVWMYRRKMFVRI